MNKFLIIFLFLINYPLLAQSDLIWQKEFGGDDDDWCYDMIYSHDGNYLTIGKAQSLDHDVSENFGLADIWLMEVNADSTLVREKSFGGTLVDVGLGICRTNDGGYAITGYSYSNDLDLDGLNSGDRDIFILKLDASWNKEWLKTYGGSAGESGDCIIQTSDGGFMVTGYTSSTDGLVNNNSGLSDYWVFKTDSQGNLVWEKTYGGTSEERSKKIIPTQDGNYVIIGSSISEDGDVTNPFGGLDFWLVKINSQGNLIWQKSLGGSATDQGYDIIELPNGDLVVVGETLSNDEMVEGNHGFTDAWIVRIDSQANLIWQNALGGTDVDYFLSVNYSSDNYILATGASFSDNGDVSENLGQSDIWLVKLSLDGTLNWQTPLGTDLNEIAYKVMSNGTEIIIAGGMESTFLKALHNNTQIYLGKLDQILPTHEVFNTENQMSIFPNPVSSVLSIQSQSTLKELSLYNQLGQLIIFNNNINENEFEIDVSKLPQALYYLEITDNNDNTNVYKIIK